MKKRAIILVSLFFLIVLVSLIPIGDRGSIIQRTISRVEQRIAYEELPEDRKNVYDKMKIEHVNVKNRVTGTAPFNSGDVSNANGVDVSDRDDYVRTFDIIKYTIEFSVVPNKSVDGVTEASVFNGGVIKVRAKLPNQGDITLMRWEKDAWMKNVEYSSDKREIYAEYYVPENTSVTNANQNLTFTVKVDGYKKEVTSDMAPEFEVWMEGNKPDNVTSESNSVLVKDSRNIVISGHGSYNVKLMDDYVNSYQERNGVKGHYIDTGVMIGLVQDNPSISDLRGIEYPVGNISIDFDLAFFAKGSDDADFREITEDTEHSLGAVNGAELIAYRVNGRSHPDFYPSSGISIRRLPFGYATSDRKKSVYDSGSITVTKDGKKLRVSFDSMKFDGQFPTMNNDTATILYTSKEGYFSVGILEFFVPYYNDTVNESMDYKFNIEAKKITFSTLTLENQLVGGGTFNDTINSDNVLSYALIKRSGRAYHPIMVTYNKQAVDYLSTNYYSGDGAIMLDNAFYVLNYFRMNDGPFDGGVVSYFSWNTNFFDYAPTDEKYSSLEAVSFGYTRNHNLDNLKVKYGLYKSDIQHGITDDVTVNNARYDDFDWYDNYDEAKARGKITSIYIDDPDNIGFYNVDRFWFRFVAVNNPDNIGKTSFFRRRVIAYGDAERTEEYPYLHYYSDNAFSPTKYNEHGALITNQSRYEEGETLLVVGINSTVTTRVTDMDSSTNLKKAYDIQDGEIHLKTIPVLSNGKSAAPTDSFIDNVKVTTVLPAGLSYKQGSANKEPSNVTFNSNDGTTTIEWIYNNWQVNRPAPEYSELSYTAEIDASLENNASLKIRSVIFTSYDIRDEDVYRSSEYGVVISNLAGSKALKSINKSVLEKNESFLVTSTLGNNGEEALRNVKTIEILPRNNDGNGSVFHGTYTSKMVDLASNQKAFYTTNSIGNIGITEDRYGKMTISEVDLENDSRWVRVNVGDVIPSNATAVATIIDSISEGSNISYTMEITPTSNEATDVYAFVLNMTSDNISIAIKTNTVIARVIDRNVTGFAFVDVNRNNVYDDGDEVLKGNTVKLLNSDGDVIATTQTSNDGKYTFDHVDKGNYYVQFSVPDKYDVVSKSETVSGVVSVVNSDGKSDKIESLNQPVSDAIVTIKNINMGIRIKEGTINVVHVEYNNETNVFDESSEKKYYDATYTTSVSSNIPDNYELKSKTSNYTGIVNADEINVVYYYQKKDYQVTNTIKLEGPSEITKRDEKLVEKITYKPTVNDYIGSGSITVVYQLEYKIDEAKSNLNGGVYDAVSKTITWTEDWDIPSIDEQSKEVVRNIELVYLDLPSEIREVNGSVTGSVKLETKEVSVSDQIKTLVKIPGTIVVKYIDKDTNEVLDSVDTTGLLKDKYTTVIKSFEGYTTEAIPDEVEYDEENQEIKYYYDKIKLKIETVVDGIGGTSEGNIIVNYGDDSTEEAIVIKADPGYVISKVTINDVEYEHQDGITDLSIKEFLNVTEDKVVRVSFEKREILENPKTGNHMVILFVIVLVSVVGLVFAYKKYFSNVESV